MVAKSRTDSAVASSHSKWLIPAWNYSPWIFMVALLACYAVSVLVRYQQFVTWKQNPKTYFVGDRPMMTTLDAPYWLRWAREYNEGSYGNDKLRRYPEGSKEFREKQQALIPMEFRTSMHREILPEKREIHYRDVPMLSFLIAKLVPLFGGNYYLTGTLVIPWLASLFILPTGIYFYRIGIPSAGLLGGLVATFCSEFFTRSSIGRIDTDMLNLFFPALASLFILLAATAETTRKVLLFSAFAGFSLFLFGWWYSKPGFTIAYFVILLASLGLSHFRAGIILTCAILFVIFSHPSYFSSGTGSITSFFERYWKFEDVAPMAIEDNDTKPASFPNVFHTISEAARVPMSEVLRQVLSHSLTGWLGFLGFALLALLRWRKLVPLLPMLALGLLGFQTSRRFIMFLAPFIGIGLGFLLTFALNLILELARSLLMNQDLAPKELKEARRKLKKLERKKGKEQSAEVTKIQQDFQPLPEWIQKFISKSWLRDLLVYGTTALLFFGIKSQTAISFVPGPSIPTPLYDTFEEVRKRVPPDSILLTWWDFGYALTDATGLSTFHDGSSQWSPKTYFIARSLISPDPFELSRITSFISTEGNQGIQNNNSSPERLMEAVRNPNSNPWDPIYLFFTADMIGKYGAFSRIGSWNLKDGGSSPKGYQKLTCQSIEGEKMHCRNLKIDLKTGTINQRINLKRVVQIMRGQLVGEKKFSHSRGYTLQIIMVNPRQFSEVQLLEEEVYLSNFNQMFLLGNYDRNLFEETMNAFPMSRLYRFKFPPEPVD